MSITTTLRGMMTRVALLASLFGPGNMLSAQELRTVPMPGCGFDEGHQQRMRLDPLYRQRVEAFNAAARHAAPGEDRGALTYTVPVVVHVMDIGTAATAISDEQIRAGIERLNENWRKVAGTQGDGTGVDMGIQFALAVRDPEGNCTSGITRRDMTFSATYVANGVMHNGAVGMPDAELKSYDNWDPTRYYNIWLVGEIDNGGPVAGYAYFASSHGSSIDGTILLAGYMPGSNVLSHELGHAFNLYHTFEGDANGTTCPPNGDCTSDGDHVCDIPPHIRPSACNPTGTNACDGGSLNSLHLFNYMNYTTCTDNMFTADQRTRAQLAMTSERASFLASNGNMSLVPPGAPQLDFRASASVLCGTGQSVTMEDVSSCLPNTYLADAEFPGISFAWTLTNGIFTYNSTFRRPTFIVNGTGVYNATLTVTTSLGTYTRTENGIVVVAGTPVAACTPTSSNECNCAQTVNNVVFGSISNATSTGTNVAYTDFTCTRNTVVASGGTYPLAVSIRAGGSAAEVLNGYIDWNNNGVFEDPSERVIQGSTPANSSTTVNANVTVPGGAVTNTLLRMRMYGEAGTFTSAERTCGAAFFVGDVEDYGVYVSSNVAGVSIAASPGSTITYGTNVTFTPTPVNGGASPVYTWFRNGINVGNGATYQSNNLMPGTTIRCEMASNMANVLSSPALSNTITMTVTGPPLTEFSGTPVALCAGGTVTYTDASLLSPTSWSWSFPGGTPTTSTAQNPVITYNTPGTYNVTLVASNANGTGTTMTKTGYINVFAAPMAACTHTRTSAPGSGIGITNVTVNTIDNNTVYDGAAMNNYTCAQTTGLQINTTYAISITGGTFNNQWFRAYIDYNNNGVFTDTGEQVFAPANAMGTVSGNFTTPSSPTLNTLLRMRVISDFVNTTPGPCTNLQYGQSEDYGIYFIPPNCTQPTATATATCANASQYNVGVNISSMGSAGSITIEVDNDAGGPNGYVAMLTVAAPGNYGPYGPYATGSPVNVRLVHNVNALCNLNFNGVVGNCDGPGGLCAYSSSGATNIQDNQTVTNTITVPPNGGQTLTDLNVYVNITHTYTSDLRLTLQSPSGTSVALINTGVCGSNDNMTVEFDQQAASAIGTVCPMTGIFAIPSASLASFNGQAIQGTWTLSVQDVAGGDEGTINSWCLIPALSAPAVQVSPKVFLEGPYSTANGLMSDAMRSAALVPNAQPYTGLGYGFTGSPGAGGTLGGGVLAVTGSNAIVDWVIVELRSTATPTMVVASCAALVQRDGDVVALDGTSPVSIAVASGAYHVAIRHRNHLGVMTLNPVALSNTPSTVDFTSVATSTYGTNARKSVAGAFPAQALWAGDVTFNGQVKYTGGGNDRDPILTTVGSATPGNTVNGYSTRDVNLNGQVKYTGSSNDRDPILLNVGSATPNNIRSAQLP